jgi:hypothetical protein
LGGSIATLTDATPTAAQSTCTNTWTGGAGDNQWTSAGNWSSGSVPDSTDDVCIGPGMSASTTVNLDEEGSVTVDSLTVGGGSGGTQTLVIDSSPVSGGNNLLTLSSTTVQSRILSDGEIELGSASAAGDFAELAASTGAPDFSNAGDFIAESTGATASAASDDIVGLDMTNTGTLEVAGNLGIGQEFQRPSAPGPVTLTNDGTLTVDSGGYFEVEGSGSNTATLTDTIGTITNDGSLEVTGAVMNQAATTVTGNEIHLVGSALNFTGSGAGLWDFQATANSVSGNMVAGQTIRVDGGTDSPFPDEDAAELTVQGSNTWGGTVILDSNGVSTDSADLEGTGTQTIPAGGLLKTQGTGTTGEAPRYLRANIDVDGGNVDLAAADNEMDWDNGVGNITITAGNMTVEGTAELDVSSHSTIDAEGGTLTDDGSLVLTGLQATFTENATDTSSSTQPILLVGQTGLVFTGPGKGEWDLQGGATLTGNMVAGQTIRVLGGTDTFPDGNAPEGDQSDADVKVEGSYSWGGTVILNSTDGQGYAAIETAGATGPSAFTETIASGGQLLSEQGGGDTRFIEFNIINNGTIDLAADHTLSDENNVITNNATMTVDGQLVGHDLNQNGDNENPVINNNGTLDLGPSAVLNVFNLTESANAHLGLTVDGNPASGDFSTIPVGTTTSLNGAGTISLAGTLDLTLPGGYAPPTIGDTFTIVSASNPQREPSVTGTFSTLNGAQITPSAAFSVGYTASAVSLVVGANTAPGGTVVLAASNVSAPTAPNTSPSPGQAVSATFHVTNTGTGMAFAPWNDSVYVGTSGTYNSSDVLLERISQTTSVGPGDAYDVTVQAFLPPLPAGGNYQLIVVPDSGARVSDPSADTQAASSPFVISPPPDLGNGPVSTTVAAGQDFYVLVNVGDSADSQVSLTQQGVDLLASPGVFPTENSSTEQASGSAGPATLVLPESTPGVWYIDLHGDDGAGAPPGESETVTAAMIGLTVTHIDPSTGSDQPDQQPSVIGLQGSDFGSDTSVTLSNLSGAQLSAYSVDVPNSTLLYASFKLDLLAAGVFDITVTSHGRTTTLSSAFTVTNASTNGVTVTATGPSSIRFGWSGSVAVTVTNVGDTEVTVPIITVSADLLGEVAAPGSSTFGQSADLVNPQFSVRSLGKSELLPPSVLPPGDSGTFLFPVQASQDEGDEDMFYTAEAVTSADPTPIDWSAQLASGQPAGLSTADWTSVVNDIATQMGSTEGSYAASLPAVFAEAAGYGITFTSQDQVFGYLIDRALATAPGAPVSGTLQGATLPGRVDLTLSDADGDPLYGTDSWYNGDFNIWDVDPGTYGLTAAGYTPRPAQQVVANPTATGLTVNLNPGATLTGVVTDASTAHPVSGATVTATDSDGTLISELTGADGAYQITGLESGAVTVTASAAGLVPVTDQTETVAASATTIDNFALQPGATVSGTITIPGGGTPPAGTLVDAVPSNGDPSQDGTLDSNGDGGYQIGGLGPGGYTIIASAPGFANVSTSVTVVGTTSQSGEDLVLGASGSVTGVVTDADTGVPIAGAIVSSDSLGSVAPVTTASDGSFTLPGLSVGTVEISATPPDDTHIAAEVSTTVTAGGTTTADLALSPTGSMSATIEDGAGNPLTGIDATLVGPTFTGLAGVVLPSTLTTDAEGSVTAADLLPGSYDLQVQGTSIDHQFTIGAASRSPSFVVTVPVATVKGVVQAGGRPASGVTVDLLVGGQTAAIATTSADGTYQFSVTRAGPVSLVAASPAVGILSASVTATVGSTTTVPTLTAGTDSLNVAVSNGSGPVTGATVSLSPSSGVGTAGAVGATTDSSGDATLDELVPGVYTLNAEDGVDAPSSQSVTVSSSNPTQVITLGAAGRISGTITDTSAAPISGAEVTAVSESGLVEGGTLTAADGTYTLPGLAPSTYSLSISEPTHAPTVVTGVSVTAGSTAVGNGVLASTGSTLSLSLEPETGSSVLPLVVVGVEDGTGTVVRTVVLGAARSASDQTASQQITELAPGPYTLLVEEPGGLSTTQTITLASGGTAVDVTAPASEALVNLPADEVPLAAQPSDVAAIGGTTSALDLAHSLLTDQAVAAVSPHDVSQGLQYLVLPSRSLYEAWQNIGLKDLPQPAGLDNEVTDATVTAILRAQFDPACSSTSTLNEIQHVLSTLVQAKNEAFSDWTEAVTAYQQILRAALGDTTLAVTGVFTALAALAAAIGPVVGIATWSLAAGGSEAATLGTALATNLAGNVIPAVVNAMTTPGPDTLFKLNQANLLLQAGLNSTLAILNHNQSPTSDVGLSVAKSGAVLSLVNAGLAVYSAIDTLINVRKPIAAAEMLLAPAQAKYQQKLAAELEAIQLFKVAAGNQTCPPPPPTPTPIKKTKVGVRIGDPGDPNGIVGPSGFSSPSPQWVAGQSSLPYVVNFQNEPTASAAAVQVVVTEAVPPDIDPDSVQLTGFGFGASTSVNIPAGQQSFSQQFTNLNLPNGDYLDVSGAYDSQAGANGVITWTFSTVDPSTGDLDSAVNAGFLPPDDAAGDGEGFVSWTGSVKSGLTTGTTVAGQASIVFDRNPAIPTPVWTNTVDATAPTASVTPLPATSTAGNLNVSWSGNDGTGSGVANYDVYESTDGGPLALLLQATTLTSTQVPIVAGHTYGFAVDATDNVGNQGAAPTAVQTTTSAVSAATTSPTSPLSVPPGYSLVASDGGIFNFGGSPFVGSAGGTALNKPIVGMAATPAGRGYWLVASDGGVFNYGDAHFYGSAGGTPLNAPIVGMAATPSGHGYWLVASDGGVFNYGDAGFYGSGGNIHLNKPIVGMAATHDGGGYWLVASDGGIFSYGDAKFQGSTGSIHLNKPIVGMAATSDGGGYWLVASDGGIFNYGDAPFSGSTGGAPLNKPIVGMAAP